MKRNWLILLSPLVLFFSCTQAPTIVNRSEIEPFLQTKPVFERALATLQSDIDFWENRLKRDTASFPDKLQLAYLYNSQFQLTSESRLLFVADSLLDASASLIGKEETDFLLQRSQQAIMLHQFRKAADYLNLARSVNPRNLSVNLVSFDTYLELGDYTAASQILRRMGDTQSFDYLIRQSKWQDHSGDLNQAIRYMEKARDWTLQNGKEKLFLWAQSNLGDMYMHSGNPEKSAKTYLEVLKKDTLNFHALQGLAWLAYAHDGDANLARTIYTYILSLKKMPELYLALSELEEYAGDTEKAHFYKQEFRNRIAGQKSQSMYTSYFAEAFPNDPQTRDGIEAELKNRPTPEVWSWKAAWLLTQNNKEEALDIIRRQVEGMTHEPKALVIAAKVYLANGEKEKAGKVLQELVEAALELGPVLMDEIEKLKRGIS